MKCSQLETLSLHPKTQTQTHCSLTCGSLLYRIRGMLADLQPSHTAGQQNLVLLTLRWTPEWVQGVGACSLHTSILLASAGH